MTDEKSIEMIVDRIKKKLEDVDDLYNLYEDCNIIIQAFHDRIQRLEIEFKERQADNNWPIYHTIANLSADILDADWKHEHLEAYIERKAQVINDIANDALDSYLKDASDEG